MKGRKYDSSLVNKIRKNAFVTEEEGISIINKVVPDDERPHVMDPRIFEIATAKYSMFREMAKAGWKLSNERYRPDKITYDLCESSIVEEEFLIEIDSDHMIDIFEFKPKNAVGLLPCMIYLHGGGMTAGDIRLYRDQMRLIAEKASAVVLFPEYRLAPECPFPGPVKDCYGTLEYVYSHAEELGINKSKIMLAGDSAGGQLTNAVILTDERHRVRKVFELYPAFDVRNYNAIKEYQWSYCKYAFIPEQEEIIRSRIERIKNAMDHESKNSVNLYLQNKTAPANPLVSAYCAEDDDLKKFPETVIAFAEFDYLTVGIIESIKKLKNLDVQIKAIRYCGCDHGFLDLLGTVVQAEECCLTISEEIRSM